MNPQQYDDQQAALVQRETSSYERERFEPADDCRVQFAIEDIRGVLRMLEHVENFHPDQRHWDYVVGYLSAPIWRLKRAEGLLAKSEVTV